MNKPKITIVLPALNSIDYITQCVDSILAQTFKEFELLCIDAGSTDGTLELFKKYEAEDARVRVINSDMRSYGHQVNLGMDAAKGDYFGIVESDDFIDPHMYEDLYRLSAGGTVDVVKGNFYDYFDYEGMKPIPAPNGERKKMPVEGSVFTVNECPNILMGHPSIWSGIYRLDFIREIGLRFLELPGGGWTDNPFFFETLCAAKSICWTSKPYYYYRKSNPNSSSNKIPDLTLPVRRMMDNLDVVEKYDLCDKALRRVYERAIIYLNGSVIDAAYPAQETEVREWAVKLYKRLDLRIVESQLNGWFKDMYYNYRSSLMLKRPRSGKVLIYDYQPQYVNSKYLILSGERLEEIRKVFAARYDLDVYVVVVRESIEPDKPFARVEILLNHYSGQLFSYEVVNNSVLTREMYDRFEKMFGEFTAEYFVTLEGIDEDARRAIGENPKVVQGFEELLDAVKVLPEAADVTLTSEEYQEMLRTSDYYHLMMENNYYGDEFESSSYKALMKFKKVEKKVRGGIRCCQEHGIPYTVKLFLRRGR